MFLIQNLSGSASLEGKSSAYFQDQGGALEGQAVSFKASHGFLSHGVDFSFL